jgi:hypothetical protein
MLELSCIAEFEPDFEIISSIYLIRDKYGLLCTYTINLPPPACRLRSHDEVCLRWQAAHKQMFMDFGSKGKFSFSLTKPFKVY